MRRLVAFLLLAAALAVNLTAQERRLRILILTGETDPSHDWRQTAPVLKAILENSGRFEVKAVEEVRGITARTLAPYDALVMHYNGPRPGPETESAIEEFVRSGKGLVSLHGVSYGPFFGLHLQDRAWRPTREGAWAAWASLLGATWKPENIGHGDRHVFPVKWVDREHPIARGLDETFLANDELYHRLDLRPEARVIASAFSDPKTRGTGRDEPIVWTVPFGKGRTVHTTLGHDASALWQPGVATAIARAAEWAATGAVTLRASVSAALRPRQEAVRVLVVTGGHDYPPAFYTLFEGQEDIRWAHATSHREAFNERLLERYDVVVLHDMHEKIEEGARAHLQAFVESGRGVVSIHHAIVNYTSWPWWHEQVIGGKYFTGKSKYQEDVEFSAVPAKGAGGHPVMRGVGPIPVVDEVYRGMWHSPEIRVLMETDHPLNDRPVVYVGPHPKARAVYIQLGHGEAAMRHPGYRRLVRNAILWTGGRGR